MFRSKVFEEGIRYPTKSHLSEDIILWINLAEKDFKFANIQYPLIEYRVTEGMYLRRSTLKKGVSEFKARLSAMRRLHMVSMKNIIYALLHLVLRVSPSFVVKWAYNNFR